MSRRISSLAELRQLYSQPQPRAVLKQIGALDVHCRRFIALSPFVLLATGATGAAGGADEAPLQLDASPRGGDPGFVKVTPEGDLLIPDAPGNNRLDTLENIVSSGGIGLLFLIPGFDETLRVNGRAVLSQDPADIAACTTERRAPKLVIRVQVQAAYLHCAKALLRSKLWKPEAQQPRELLPTAGQMISEQTGLQVAPETREDMERRYAPDL